MSIINKIRFTLDSHLDTGSNLPTVAKENTKINPVTGSPFIRAYLTPTSRRPAVRGLNPQQRYEGIYTLLVCTPEGSGSGGAYTICDNLLTLFNATTDVENPNYPTDPLIVHIDRSELDNSFIDSPFFCTPVNVFWYCYN